MSEYEEQKHIEAFALARHQEATGVKNIQPLLLTDKKADAWLVILTTVEDWRCIITLVTTEDLKQSG